jgi:arylsulfatase A-like enzyme
VLDELNGWEDTIVIFTSDHGDMCGSHGLRSKGPFVYDEIMRVPLYVRAPGITRSGTRSEALATHVDLARTIVELAGADASGLPGADLSSVLRDPAASVRDSVVLAQEQSWYAECVPLCWASRALYDGRYKYARYFGRGGGYTQFGQPTGEPMKVGPDAPFEEQEHELYDHRDDPHELRNLARDPAYAKLTRELFGRLLDEEARAFV